MAKGTFECLDLLEFATLIELKLETENEQRYWKY